MLEQLCFLGCARPADAWTIRKRTCGGSFALLDIIFHEGISMALPANSALLHTARRNGISATAREPTRTIRTHPPSTPGDVFCFGRCRLIVRERLLLQDDVRVSVGSRAFDLLLTLVERAGETVSSQELFERVWPDVIVAKVNLRVHVAGLRKALGDGHDRNRFIVSVAGRGYRFVAPVRRFTSEVPAAALRTPSTTAAAVPMRSMIGVAFAIARTLAADLDDTVCFVDFAGIEDPAHVPIALAAALGCEIESQRALNCVLGYLHDKKMLLVVEHCEHVFAGVAQLIERLLTEAPRVQILINSRPRD